MLYLHKWKYLYNIMIILIGTIGEKNMDLNNALNLQTRRDIYNCILKYPGIHLRQIFREIKCSQGSVRYNVKYLKKCKLVLEKKRRRLQQILCIWKNY